MKKTKISTKAMSLFLAVLMVFSCFSGLSLTAWAADPYADLKNTTTVITFDNKQWYMIEDNSTSATEGTVTLLSKECVGKSVFGSNNTYSGSTLETYVNNWYSENITADDKTAVADNKAFILESLNGINTDVLKCNQVEGTYYNLWWLSSPSRENRAKCVDGQVGYLDDGPVGWEYGVRPVLQLDLSKVEFDSETKTFALPAPSAYAGYVPAEADDATALAAKVVKFNGHDWYMIEDNSTSATEGTVTLFAKECVGASEFGTNNTYSGSTVETYVNNWYTSNISADAKAAVDGNGMFLLTSDQASALSSGVRKCSEASGADTNLWWLCTPFSYYLEVMCVDGDYGVVRDGEDDGTNVKNTLGVRPALKLDLSKVEFDSETKTFALPQPLVEYPLWVGGVKVTSENMSGEGWNYAADTNTLTLNGYTNSGTARADIQSGVNNAAIYYNDNMSSPNPLTIQLAEGTTNSLTMTGDRVYGIYVFGSALTITGNGTLNVQSDDMAINDAWGVAITGGTVNAASSAYYGIGRVTIGADISSVTITGKLGAIYGGSNEDQELINAVAGTGWTDTAGTTGKAAIATSTTGQNVSSYKKVYFTTETAAQTITASDVTATYGDTNKSVSATVTNPTEGGGAISYAVKEGSTDYIDVNASTGALTIKKVPADGKAYVIVTAAATDDCSEATLEVTVTIAKKEITVSDITANNKVYDGNSNATIDTSHATISGALSGDTLTVSADASFSDRNVAEDKTVYLSNITLGGESASNYTLASSGQQETTTASITAKAVTISGITANNKVYDGTTVATINYTSATIQGMVSGDDLSIYTDFVSSHFADKNVGNNKTVTISYLLLTGSDAANYTVGSVTVTANITAKEVGLEWSNTELTYNGKAQKPTATATGLAGQDTCTVTVVGEQTNAGDNYTATAQSLSNSNYKLPENKTTAFKINKANQTAPAAPTEAGKTINSITLNTIPNGEYKCGAGDWQTSPTFTGLDQNKGYVFRQRYAADENHNASAGSEEAVIRTANHTHSFTYSASNGTITATCNGVGTCNLTDNKVSFTLTAPTSLVYDGTDKKATLEGVDAFNAATGLNVSANDIVYNDLTDVVTETKNAGTYQALYTLQTDFPRPFVGITFTVAKANPTYEAPKGLYATYGDTLADVALPDGWAWVDDTTSVGDAGTKAFKANFTPADTTNYNVVENVDVTVKVNQADIAPTVSLDGWTYGDEANKPVLEGNTGKGAVTYLYKEKGASDMSCTDEVPTQAGEYTLKAIIDETANYNGGEATADFTIAKAKVTITADDKAIMREAALKELTYKVEGKILDSDDLGIKVSSNVKAAVAGKYDIKVSYTENANYDVTAVNGTYTVIDRVTPREMIIGRNYLNSGAKGGCDTKGFNVYWTAVPTADRVEVYATYCGGTFQKVKTLDGKATSFKITALNGKKIDTSRCVNAYVVAYRLVNGKYEKVANCLSLHIAGITNKTYTNAKAITVKNDSVTLSVNKSTTLKPTIVKANNNKKMIDHKTAFRYQSTNTKIATVDANGKITAVGKGSCTIYVCANNGKLKSVKVTVK